jgi:diguanylate cyclase (GGDEF)-like protein/PAS domain S-box-containing protein
LPREIYVSHVEALFDGAGTFAIGVAGSSAMTFIAGCLGHHTLLIAIAAALLALGLARLWSMARFKVVRGTLADSDLRRWERGYIVGGATYLSLLGLSNLVTFGSTDDQFARLASLAVTMAYLVGTPGRSFASPILVNVQVIAASVPVLAGMAIAGGAYWWIEGLILVPFFVALKSISTRLNGIFLAAVMRTLELGRLAKRFDTALNNMPQGLAMFDVDGSIAVVNERLLAMLGLERRAWHEGSTLDDLIAAWRDVAPSDVLEKLLAGSSPSSDEYVIAMANGRSTSVRMQSKEYGGGVLLVEDVTERVRAQEEISHLARFDSLTGMHNRRSFRAVVRALADRHQSGEPALLFIDLDRFKAVNDTLGHVVGDRLVMDVAERLRLAAGPEATLGRFGGDEFVLYQCFPSDCNGAEDLAAVIIQSLSEPFHIEGQRVTVGASVGIATAQTTGGEVDDLLRDADLALYRAKVEGRGTFRVFAEDMKVSAEKRRHTEEDLRGAIGRGELELHYQPIYSVGEMRFVVCEALVRWRHPVRGLVPPSDFIPIAEETGMIVQIGEWVLRRACAECLSWPPNVSVAVNFSAVQFQRGDVPAALTRALAETGLPPERLELEVTESLLLNDLQATALVLRQITSAGVKLSLDDFGTGFSSLSYLQSLPFSKVKIDRSFLKGLDRDSRAMVLLRGIQRLSSDLGMSVVMEGVETPEQLSLVVETASVDLIQGFLMSRPLPARDVRDLLATWQDRGPMNGATLKVNVA